MKIKIAFTIMLLTLVALVPAAVSAQGNDYGVTSEKAFEQANVHMLAFIATDINESGKWEGASIDPKPLELYDINGQKLYYEFSVYNKDTLISRIDIGANETLGGSLRRIEIDPKSYNAAEAIKKSIETAKTKYPTGKIVSTKMVVYDYPGIGAMTTVKDKTTGVEHRIFVDIYTLDVIPDKPATEKENGVWSMYEHVVKNKADENLKDWQSSEQFIKTLKQQANDVGINNMPVTKEDIKKLSNKLSVKSEVMSSPHQSMAITPATNYISEQRVNFVPLYYQTKQYYCQPACAQMIAAWWGYSYTQDYIYTKMGGTNGDLYGIAPTSAKNWYLRSPSQGGIGAVRSSLSSTDRTITTAKNDLDKGLSFHSLTQFHSRVCAGYLIYFDHSGQDCLYLNDPLYGQYWEALSGSPELQRIYVHFI